MWAPDISLMKSRNGALAKAPLLLKHTFLRRRTQPMPLLASQRLKKLTFRMHSGYVTNSPPSTMIACPFTEAAPAVQIQLIVSATSEGSTKRFIGLSLVNACIA